MMQCDARSVYVLKTMEFHDFREIFRGAERANICIRTLVLLEYRSGMMFKSASVSPCSKAHQCLHVI